MQLVSLTLENYRSFVGKTKFELRPLTLFFGYNSAGKSSLIRSIPLLSESLRGIGSPIELDHPSTRQAGFGDILTRPPLGKSGKLNIEMEFKDVLSDSSKVLIVKWSILEASDLHRQIIDKFEVWEECECIYTASFNLESDTSKRDLVYNVKHRHFEYLMQLPFQGLLPMHDKLLHPRAHDFLEKIGSAIKGRSTSVQWLTSVRAAPPRSLRYSGGAPLRLKPDGVGASEVLAYDSLVTTWVSEWFQEHLGQKLIVVRSADSFQIALEDMSLTPLRVPLADAGEGLIQAFPVLVAAAMAVNGGEHASGILAVEEPESHLHPRLHAALAEQFCKAISGRTPAQIILETHSENMLLEIQNRIADGRVDPKSVMVYWVRCLKDGAGKIEAVTFDSYGRPEKGTSLPRGVFAEDVLLSKRLLEKQRQRVSDASDNKS